MRKTKEQLRAAMPGKRFGPPPLKGPASQGLNLKKRRKINNNGSNI
jgi:hypothetical protein